LLFLVLFAACWAGMFVVASIAFKEGARGGRGAAAAARAAPRERWRV
jgi:hypothetical protein